MSKEIEFGGEIVKIDYEKYLSQHDIVYLSPATEGFEGFPIGNGDLTAMVWTPPEEIRWHINKCDLWDDAPEGHFKHWAKDWEEKATYLRGGCDLLIQNTIPAFDWKYLKDFEGRLQMYPAQVSLHADTPFSSVNAETFVSKAYRCLIVDYEDKSREEIPRQIILRRWGSRVFSHYYHQIVRDPSLGLKGTESGCDKNHVWITHKTRSLTFAVACRLNGFEFKAKRTHSHEAVFSISPVRKAKFRVYLSVVTSEESQAPLKSALGLVDDACKKGIKHVKKAHQEEWTNFWRKSFVNIPDKYIENLWYFNLYQVGSSYTGKSPPPHGNSIWNWEHDFMPWSHYYHWNFQQYTWWLHSSGHPELFLSYARFRRSGLPHAMEDAKEIFKCRGAWFSDVSNRKGYQSVVREEEKEVIPGELVVDHGLTRNLTPGPQIAMDLYRHYQYTLDENYLKEFAYPVMREVVRFYCDYLKKEEDGRYHLPCSCPYEGNGLCKDTTTDLACIRQLFPAFIETSRKLGEEIELIDKASEILNNLADFVTMELPPEAILKVVERPSGKILAAGINLEDGKPYHQWLTDTPEKARVIFKSIHETPIFPASLVGLDQKGTEEFEISERTLKCFDAQDTIGIFICLIAQTRMGLKDLVKEGLSKWVKNYQIFCQGFFSYYQRKKTGRADVSHEIMSDDNPNATNMVLVINGKPGEKTRILRRPFVQTGLDTASIFQATINEMLLQSYNGLIRVFPAMPDDWEGCFILHAVGGFVVMSEKTRDGVSYVTIESLSGSMCRIVNPWNGSERVHVLDITDNKEVVLPTSDRELSFVTTPEHIYYVERINKPVEIFKREVYSGKPNQFPKEFGEAILGRHKLL